MTREAKTIWDIVQELGIEHGYHASDLQVPDNETTRAIIAAYPDQAKNAKPFKNAQDGTRWIEIPFAYLPFWTRAKD